MHPRRASGRGFTLVEILVALAIVAVALTAGMRALTQATDSATALKQRTVALWVAQDRMAANQLGNAWPALGGGSGQARQAGRLFAWRQTVTATANPAFRRIEIVVTEPTVPNYALALLVGYIARPESP